MLIAACSSSTTGKGEQAIDVDKAKITGSVPVSASAGGQLLISPDGRHLLGHVGGKLCVFDSNGAHQVCADAQVSADITYATWSPDSTKITFTDDFYKAFHEPDIWTMDAGTGKATDLTDDGVTKAQLGGQPDPKTQFDLFPSWSPDSRSIRFARQAGGYTGTTIDIESIPAAGGQPRTIGTVDGQLIELAGLAFSPDGKTIAWTRAADSGWTNTTVHVRKLTGSGEQSLPEQKADQSQLSFSPDGTYLLVDSRATYGSYSCCATSSARVYPADGTAGAQVVAQDAVALFPGWAPSGHALAFTTPMPHSGIDLVAEPGGTPRVLKSGTACRAPNGQQLQWTAAGLFVWDTKPVIYQLGQ